MKLVKFVRLALVLALGLAWHSTTAQASPRYIFLFIGDGMSIPQRMTAEEFAATIGYGELAINHLPHQALTTTRSASSVITDSAAAATAIACGEKTVNGRVGMDTTGKRRLTSVAEEARRAGRKVGIITTVTLNHATPASFYGHQTSRGMGYALGLDLIASGFDYFAGGGLSGANDAKAAGFRGNVYDLAGQAGYLVTRQTAEFRALKPGAGKVLAPLADEDLPYAIDRKAGDPPALAELVAKGIELLDGPGGFFMMAEGGKIDWKCHANDAGTVVHEVIDFDKAVKVALEFARKHPDETLVVVTGDHETGGLTMGFAGTGYACYIERLTNQVCSGDAFSKKLAAVRTQAEFRAEVTKCFGLQFSGTSPMALTADEIAALDRAFAKRNEAIKTKTGANYKNGSSRLTSRVIQIFNNKCGLAWTSGCHTALPVSTTAQGVGAEKFAGQIDNTGIARILSGMINAK